MGARFIRTGTYAAGYERIIHVATGDVRWVSITAITREGMATAFYDADPAYLPPGAPHDAH